jgi:hypothetical protein
LRVVQVGGTAAAAAGCDNRRMPERLEVQRAEGTLVTSYYDWSGADQAWKDAAIFPVIPESALRATLGILARTVAPGKPRPASAAR